MIKYQRIAPDKPAAKIPAPKKTPAKPAKGKKPKPRKAKA